MINAFLTIDCFSQLYRPVIKEWCYKPSQFQVAPDKRNIRQFINRNSIFWLYSKVNYISLKTHLYIFSKVSIYVKCTANLFLFILFNLYLKFYLPIFNHINLCDTYFAVQRLTYLYIFLLKYNHRVFMKTIVYITYIYISSFYTHIIKGH